MHSAASILASVKEQEARFERLTRALEQERRHVALQLERAQQPGMGSSGVGSGQPLSMAWQQLVLQVTAQGLRKGENGQVGKKSRGVGGPQASMQWLIARPGASGEGKKVGFQPPWVCRASCDKWAGHSPTLRTALSTCVSPQGPDSWAESVLGSSAVSLVTLRVLLPWSLSAFVACISQWVSPGGGLSRAEALPAAQQVTGHCPCSAPGGVEPQSALGQALRTLKLGCTVRSGGLVGSSQHELCRSTEPSDGAIAPGSWGADGGGGSLL